MKTIRILAVLACLLTGLTNCSREKDVPTATLPTWQLADSLADGPNKLMVDARMNEKGFLAAVSASGIWTYDSLGRYPSLNGTPGSGTGPIRSITTTILLSKGLNLSYDPVWNNRYYLTTQPSESLLNFFNYSSLSSRSGELVPINQLLPAYSASAVMYNAGGSKPIAAFNDVDQCLIPIRDTEPGYVSTGLSYALITVDPSKVQTSGFTRTAVTAARKIKALADAPIVSGEQRLPNPGVTVFGFKDRFFVGLSNDTHFNNMVLPDGTVRSLALPSRAEYFTFQDRLYAIYDVSSGKMQVRVSNDKGDTWQDAFTITGGTYASAITFTEMAGSLYAFVNQQLWQVNAATGQFTEVSGTGLQKSTITSVIQYGPWVYAMTLSGLYRIRITDFPRLLMR